MAEFIINGNKYKIEPYSCTATSEFPFYINVTNACNAKCEFCLNASNKNLGKLNYTELKSILDQVKNHISRISISGGESLFYPDEIEKSLFKQLDEKN